MRFHTYGFLIGLTEPEPGAIGFLSPSLRSALSLGFDGLIDLN